MRSRIIGIVLIIVSLGVDVWLGTALATGSRATGISLAFVLISLPFLAVGIYFLLSARGEVKAESKADKERAILNSVMTRGKVSIPDLAIEGNLTRDQVKDTSTTSSGRTCSEATSTGTGARSSRPRRRRSRTAPAPTAAATWNWPAKAWCGARSAAPRRICRRWPAAPRRRPRRQLWLLRRRRRRRATVAADSAAAWAVAEWADSVRAIGAKECN